MTDEMIKRAAIFVATFGGIMIAKQIHTHFVVKQGVARAVNEIGIEKIAEVVLKAQKK